MFVKRRAKLCLVFALIFLQSFVPHSPANPAVFPHFNAQTAPTPHLGAGTVFFFTNLSLRLLGERKNGRAEEFARRIGHYAVHLPIHGNGDAAATALAHAERGLKIHLVMQAIFLNHLLKRLNHVVRAFQMAGTSDTNADFYHTQ
jgi:hypothetical protein